MDKKPDKLIVTLQKQDAGSQNKRRFPELAKKYPDTVVIERVSISYSLRKKGGSVGSTETLVQFPIKVTHAITAHKIQGQTIPKPHKVALDISSIFEDAQAHVMLSIVNEFEQLDRLH